MINPRPARSTAMVVLTWWLITTVLCVLWWPDRIFDFKTWLAGASHVASAHLLGVSLGIGAMVLWIASNRAIVRLEMSPSQLGGVTSTLGPVPQLVTEPRFSVEPLKLDELSCPDVPESYLQSWMDRFNATHPLHVALFEKLLRIYKFNSDLPATHIPGGHGGRSLLEHSLLVMFVATELRAPQFEYLGWAPTGKRIVVPLTDPSYRFEPNDPLIGLIALAHDLGKLESFIIASKGGRRIVEGSKREHDMAGARMLARIPEFRALPAQDQFAMSMAIGHYHRPQLLPLDGQRQAIDDRTIALMELLILADKHAGYQERSGQIPTSSDLENPEVMDTEGENIQPGRLWEELVELLLEPNRIDSTNPTLNVGSYTQIVGANTPLLVLHEATVRQVLSQRLRVNGDVQDKARRYIVTSLLLKEVAKREALRCEWKCDGQLRVYEPENALWKVTLTPKKGKPRSWPAAIILNPTVVPGLKAVISVNNKWLATVPDGFHGARYAKKPDGTFAHEVPVDDPLPSSTAEVEVPSAVAEPIARTFAGRLPLTAPLSRLTGAPNTEVAAPAEPDPDPVPPAEELPVVSPELVLAAEQQAEAEAMASFRVTEAQQTTVSKRSKRKAKGETRLAPAADWAGAAAAMQTTSPPSQISKKKIKGPQYALPQSAEQLRLLIIQAWNELTRQDGTAAVQWLPDRSFYISSTGVEYVNPSIPVAELAAAVSELALAHGNKFTFAWLNKEEHRYAVGLQAAEVPEGIAPD